MAASQRPIFPHMGWSCIACRRAFAGMQERWGCPYCPTPQRDHQEEPMRKD